MREDDDVVMRTVNGHIFHLDFYNGESMLYEGRIEVHDGDGGVEFQYAQYRLDDLLP
jgi:hypothetical protein